MKKRISFYIDNKLYDALSFKAKEVGIPMSKLLTKWIDNTPKLIVVSPSREKKQKIYNFRVEEGTIQNLYCVAREYDLNISDTIRCIIYTNLANNNVNSKQVIGNQILTLWRTGNLKELNERLSLNIEMLGSDEYRLLALTNTHIGTLENVYKVYELALNKYPDDLEALIFFKLILAKVEIQKRNLHRSSILLEEVKESPYLFNNQLITGYFFLYSGYLHIFSGDIERSIDMFENALLYFDAIKYPNELLEAMLNVYNCYAWNNDEVIAERYRRKTIALIKGLNNKYYYSWYLNSVGHCEAYKDYKNPKTYSMFIKSKQINAQGNSFKEEHYTFEYLGMIEMVQRNYSKAYNNLQNAQKYEKNYRLCERFSTVKYMQKFIEAKDNISSLNHSTDELNDPVCPNKIKYLYYSAKYVHEDSSNLKVENSSVQELKKLADTTDIPALKKSIVHTIKTKELAMFC